jgi:hypothetical protein
MLYKKKTRSTSASKAKTQVARRVLKKGRTDVQKKLDKKVLEAIIKTVLEKEKEIKKDNKIRLPKRYLNNLVETYAPVLPTLTLKSLENAVSYQRKKEMNLEQPQTVEPDQTKTDSTDPVQTNTDDKGRPTGTTQEMKLIKKRQVEIELGLDLEVDADIGSYSDVDFVKKNTGPGKRFPGGPTCHFRGKEIPCFVRFQEKGGMTGEILLDIFKTLDYYKLFDNDRKDGRRPFFLIKKTNPESSFEERERGRTVAGKLES